MRTIVFVLYWVLLVEWCNSSAVKGSGEPLFAKDHVNITFITDKNFKELVTGTTKPWLIDFYHPLYVRYGVKSVSNTYPVVVHIVLNLYPIGLQLRRIIKPKEAKLASELSAA